MSKPPVLSDEARAAALAKAAQARRIRAELKQRLKMGSLSLQELLDKADADEIVAKTKVLAVLESLPGVGKVKARRTMEEIGIAENRRLRGWATTSAASSSPPLAEYSAPQLDERMVVVISGPGGVGKGTIVAQLLDRDPRLWLSRSWTTRTRRPGESMEAYHFTNRELFLSHVDNGGFLEWVEFLDYLQGTPVPDPPPGHDVVFEIDVYGAAQIKERLPGALLIFIDAPSRDHQEARLRGRGDPDEKVAARLAKAADEVAKAASLDSVVVVNDDLERALGEVELLIEARRAASPDC